MMSSLTVQAATPTCDQVLSLCDKALDAKDKELKLCNLGLVQTLDAKEALRLELEEVKDKQNSIFRNPFLYLGIGLIAGGLLVK